jgi:hypothetical protein
MERLFPSEGPLATAADLAVLERRLLTAQHRATLVLMATILGTVLGSSLLG